MLDIVNSTDLQSWKATVNVVVNKLFLLYASLPTKFLFLSVDALISYIIYFCSYHILIPFIVLSELYFIVFKYGGNMFVGSKNADVTVDILSMILEASHMAPSRVVKA